jgi:hypothetical protein
MLCMDDVREQDRLAARGLDITVPNVARIYDYILGGKDNFDADRAAAAKILAVIPGGSGPALTNRAFLGRVVHFLAAERGTISATRPASSPARLCAS